MRTRVRAFKSSVFLSLLFIAVAMQGCFLVHVVKDGETLYTEKKYNDAAEKLKEEINQDQAGITKPKKSFLIAECYRLSFNTIEAEKWYQIAVGYNYDPIATYDYALMLKANGKYDLAIEQFKEYMQDAPFNEDAKRQLKATQQALDWQQHPAPYIITNLEAINSPAFDYAPVMYKDNALVFTSDRSSASGDKFGWTGEQYTDIFIAESDGKGGYKEPKSFSSVINTEYNEGEATFSADFNECYYAHSGKSANDINAGYCKIYYTNKNPQGEWNPPQKLNFFSDTCNVNQPFLSPDGKELYLSSDAEGGFGGKDLYVCTKTADGWSDPVNLGPQINTTGDEVFPSLYDGKLYFASNGLPGMGGLDIFVATKSAKQWTNPQNLKPPINSPADDFGILWQKVPTELATKEKATGLFTSNRPGGKGNDDIYQFTLPKVKVYVLNGTVLQKVFEDPKDPNSRVTGNAPINAADVTVASGDTGKPATLKSDAKGNFHLLVAPEKLYKVTASKPEYFTKSETTSSMGFTAIEKDTVKADVRIMLDKIYREVMINISNIYYDYNKANIRTDAALVLDTVVTLLKENPQVKVEIGSHTDSRGNAAYNMKLSQARAQAAVAYLVAHGIDQLRLSAKGYGATQLTNGCGPGVPCTEEEHQKNRRTTFKVLSETIHIESKEPLQIIQDPNKK